MGNFDGDLYSFGSHMAIVNFQEDYGLEETGIIKGGLKASVIYLYDLYRIKDYIASSGNDKKEIVRRLQAALKIKGFYHGIIDGEIGKNTKEGAYSYQKYKGIEVARELSVNDFLDLVDDAESSVDDLIAEELNKINKKTNWLLWVVLALAILCWLAYKTYGFDRLKMLLNLNSEQGK